MVNRELLNFDEFESRIINLFESNKENKNVTLVSQIMNYFYSVYAALLPLADDYKNILTDIKAIASEGEPTKKDPTGKTEAMNAMIDSIISEVNPKYKELMPEFKASADLIINSYTILLGKFDDEDSKEIREIVNIVSKSAVDFISNLKDSKKEIRENEDFSKYDELLFEARNMKERNEILKSMVTVRAAIQNNIELGGLSALKGTFNGYKNELQEILDKVNVNNEDYWKGMKRVERKEKLEEFSNRLNEIPLEMGEVILKYTRKLGADSESIRELENGVKSFESAMEKLSAITTKDIQKGETSEEEEKKAAEEMGVDNESDEKEDKKEYVTIDPEDIENLRKKGKNLETIKKYQGKINQIMKLDKEYKEIKVDGLYGKNTITAVKQIQLALNKLGAGLNQEGKLTGQTQKTIDAFEKNKDKISDLLKK